MAVSVSNVLSVPYRVVGNQKETVTDVTCSEEYVEEGESLTFANLGLSNVEYATTSLVSNATEAELYLVPGKYDTENEKLLLYNGKTGKELAAEEDVSSLVVRVVARGW